MTVGELEYTDQRSIKLDHRRLPAITCGMRGEHINSLPFPVPHHFGICSLVKAEPSMYLLIQSANNLATI